jgi:predicted transcriptional regulator
MKFHLLPDQMGNMEWPEIIDYFRLYAKHNGITKAMIEAGKKPKPENNDTGIISLTEKEIKVLSYLAKRPTLIQYQADIESGTERTRKTISKYLKKFESHGLIEQPKGSKQGYKITQKGLDWLKNNDA